MENTYIKLEKAAVIKPNAEKKPVAKKPLKTNDKSKLSQLEKARTKLKELRAAAAAKGEKYISKRRAKAQTIVKGYTTDTVFACGSEN